MKKIIICSLCIVLLCGCSKTMNEQDNTTSNITESTTTSESELSTDLTTELTTTPTITEVGSISNYSTKKVVWGPGNIENHQVPTDPKNLQNTFAKLNGEWLLNDKKSICLTFDEGYENGFTPVILDTLKAKNVKAIFFVTYDFAKANSKLIKRMIDEGHIIGNHTYRHYTMDEISTDVAKEEVTFLHEYMKKTYNYTMSYFRFPKGEFSEQSLALVNSLNYKSIFWSFAYADWDVDNPPNEDESFRKIVESTHPGEIMLLHAVSKTNANILGKVIDDVKQQGYNFTTKI